MTPGAEDLLAEDRAARRLAQSEFTRPVVLEAGAGTGKTTTLVGRLLAWVLGPGWERAADRLAQRSEAAEPEAVARETLSRVVAITFTEAAAAEMAERAGQALAAVAAGEPPPWLETGLEGGAPAAAAVLSPRARALVSALHHLSARTIHAFCRGLLAAHPLEAGLHPALTVDADGARVEEVAREMVEGRLAAVYGDPGDPHFRALAARGLGATEIAEALCNLLREGVPAAALSRDPFGPASLAAFRDELGRRLADLERAGGGRLEAARGRGRSLTAGALDALVDTARALRDPPASSAAGPAAAGELCQLLAELWQDKPLGRLRDWGRGKFNKSEAEGLGDRRGAVAAAAGPLHRLLRHGRRLDPPLLDHARRALGPLLAAAHRELRARGIATFQALLAEACQLLERRPAVRRRVRAGIDQLLVDEFQDTDRLQCAIVRLLALDGSPEERPGLFLVGDPKQSIYGWRNADLAAYDGFLEEARRAGGVVRPLRENFRSVPAILDEVERAVAPVMVERRGLQPRFEPLLPCRRLAAEAGFTAGDRRPVEYWISWRAAADGGGARTPAARATDLEAEAVARDLAELRAAGELSWGDAGLLLRGLRDLDVYLEALRRAGIPFAVGRDKQYYRRREIIEAAALVRAVLDPGDHLALLTVLRSPAVGVPDAALLPLWRRGLPRCLTELTAPAPERLAELRELIAGAAAEVAREVAPFVPGLERVAGWEASLAAAVSALAHLRRSFELEPADVFVERLRGLLGQEWTESARYLGGYRLANLERFFRQLLAALEDGGGDTAAVLRLLRRRVAEGTEQEEGRPREGREDAVRVMTIHGAKGLDFEHVYLLQLHKEDGGGRAPGTAVARGAAGDWEYTLLGLPTPGYFRVEEGDAAVEAAERARLLYVAMTRAKRRLVLAGKWEAGAPRPPREARHHAHLLAHRRPPAPELAALMAELEREGGDRRDAAGARWVFPALTAETPAVAEPPAPAPLPPPARVAADAARLAELRAAAAERARRPFATAASEEAHGELAELLTTEARDAAATEGTRAAADRGVAMAAGSAVHRALETFDFTADPQAELERQVARLPSYLAPLSGGEEADGAAERAAALLRRLAAGPLLERLCRLAGAIVARELPVLLPPGTGSEEGKTGAVGFVSGAIDLLYRDPASGELVVADFKTDEVAPGPALERRAAAYASQGRLYQRAVRDALDLPAPPRFELWFLHAGQVVGAPALAGT